MQTLARKKTVFGANVSVAGFYRQSHNAADLAQYYGAGMTDADRLGTIPVAATEVTYVTDAGTVTLNPRRIEYGAQFNWNQCLGQVCSRLELECRCTIGTC